jgi:hypothetical protein
MALARTLQWVLIEGLRRICPVIDQIFSKIRAFWVTQAKQK